MVQVHAQSLSYQSAGYAVESALDRLRAAAGDCDRELCVVDKSSVGQELQVSALLLIALLAAAVEFV